MAVHTYRYRLQDVTDGQLSKEVPGSPVIGPLAPAIFVDIDVDSAFKADLDEAMLTRGYVYFSTDPTTSVEQDAEVRGEVLGPPDGVATTFLTAFPFIPGTTRVFHNGLRQEAGTGNDYVENMSSTGIIMSIAPKLLDKILVDYSRSS